MDKPKVLYLYINHTLLLTRRVVDIMQSNRKDVTDITHRLVTGFYDDGKGSTIPFEIFTDRINDDRDLKEIVMDSLRAQSDVLDGRANTDYAMKYILNVAINGGPVEIVIFKKEK